MPTSRFHLYRDDELGVLWLTARRAELALSAEGIWLKAGRGGADLRWEEIEQVQQGDVRRGHARIEVFRTDGSTHAVGPFPAAKGEQWVRAAGNAAQQAGREPRPLLDSAGFALSRTG